jgi:hypothetical protein
MDEEGVEYALATTHGTSCGTLNGFAEIVTTSQCHMAAKSFELPTRQQPLSMIFMEETWYLVRRVHGGSAEWHRSTDDLAGIDLYGEYSRNATSDTSFSTPFGQKYTKVLLASGDRTSWIILDRNGGCLGKNATELISTSECGAADFADGATLQQKMTQCKRRWYPSLLKSSSALSSYPMAMSCVTSFAEDVESTINIFDPKVVLSSTAISTQGLALPGETLYAEASMSSRPADRFPLPESGANVWVNHMPNDGFSTSRVEQVTGCSLDGTIANATTMQLHTAGVSWHSHSSAASS